MAVATPELPEGMQFRRSWIAKELVPGVRSEGRDAGESSINVAELYRANQPGKVAAEGTYSRVILGLRLHSDNKKDGCTRERPEHRLRKRNLIRSVECHRPICLDLLRFCFIVSFPCQSNLHLSQNLRYHRQAVLRKSLRRTREHDHPLVAWPPFSYS